MNDPHRLPRSRPLALLAAGLLSVLPAAAQEEPHDPAVDPAATTMPAPAPPPFFLPSRPPAEPAEAEEPDLTEELQAPMPGLNPGEVSEEEPAAPPPAPAGDPRLAALLESSPFLPEGFRPPGEAAGGRQPEAPPQRAVELRGVYELGGETFVNLFNLGTQKGEWLKVGEQRGPYNVQRYDSGRNLVFVTVGGRAEEIAMKKPSDQPIPVQAAPAAPVPAPGAVASAAAANRAAPGAAPGTPVPRPRRIVLPPTTPSGDAASGPGGGGAGRAAVRRPGTGAGGDAQAPGGNVINIEVPDPSNPGSAPVTSGSPSGPAPILRQGADGTPSGTLTPEQLIQLLQSRSGQNPNP